MFKTNELFLNAIETKVAEGFQVTFGGGFAPTGAKDAVSLGMALGNKAVGKVTGKALNKDFNDPDTKLNARLVFQITKGNKTIDCSCSCPESLKDTMPQKVNVELAEYEGAAYWKLTV